MATGRPSPRGPRAELSVLAAEPEPSSSKRKRNEKNTK